MSTGLLGGFTTFSAFSNETVGLIRLGNLSLAMGYVLSSVCVGLLATWLGYALPRLLNY
jgi:fluoride exporter